MNNPEIIKKRIDQLIKQEGSHFKALLDRISFLINQIDLEVVEQEYLDDLTVFYEKTKELLMIINPDEEVPELLQ